MKSARTITVSLLSTFLLALCGSFYQSAAALEPDARSTIQSFTVGVTPGGLAFDGANIWITTFDTDEVTKLRASDGTVLGTFPAAGLTIYPVLDGPTIWMTN